MALQDKAKIPILCVSFHGESWYRCPWCNEEYEYYDTVFERGFEKTNENRVYKHKKCGNYVWHK